VGGVVNHYLKVDSVFNDDIKYDPAYSVDGFSRGDLVMLIQMTGATADSFNVSDAIPALTYEANNAGTYELLSVDQIIPAEKRIVFTAEIMGNFTSGERIQLVRVKESEADIVVDDEINAQPWDGETGGIIALFTLEKLVLNDNIDASASGFRGADPDQTNYTGGINPGDTLYYDLVDTNRAALKGEGYFSVLDDNFNFRRGRGHWGNGGGGGNGLYSGGGGGGHVGSGGAGGSQYDNNDPSEILAAGGVGTDISGIYNLRDGDFVLMGGGGGTSTQNLSDNREATAGGDGGGIVLIVADSIITNGNAILSNGESVTETATAGGGGAGAGGAIFMDINKFGENVHVEVKGGLGGLADGDCTGSGGSGGGGIIWISSHSEPTGLTEFLNGGGIVSNCNPPYYGRAGSNGLLKFVLKTPLNGYYFNAVDGSDTLCEGQLPDPLTGSVPKGGNGDFDYYWQESFDQENWTNVGVQADSLEYQPPVVTSTVYYRRVVVAYNGSADTSKNLELFVYPKIEDNNIADHDTICTGGTTELITGTTIATGGDGNFTYQWQWSNTLNQWNEETEELSNNPYNAGTLNDTTYIRRLITSVGRVCQDYSDTVSIIVLPDIGNNNLIETTQTICESDVADTIRLTSPTGGDPAYYEYEWLQGTNSSGYTSVSASNVTFFVPGSLTDSMHYKRIVKSGIEHACMDTSNEHSIFVLPSISSNSITDESTICAGNKPDSILGTFPAGGNAEFNYQWLWRTNISGYSEIPDSDEKSFTPDDIFADTTHFKRVVLSGLNAACRDTSNEITLEVIPYINNIVQDFADSLCAGQSPELFSGETATGGVNSFSYFWENQNVAQGGNFTEIPEAIGLSYQATSLFDSTYFRRAVVSGICTTYSDTFRITVFPAITNNTYNNGLIDSACFNTTLEIDGKSPVGGLVNDRRYIWEQSDDSENWQPAADAPNDSSYFTPALTDSMYYRRIVQSGLSNECVDTAAPVLIRINPLPWGDIKASYDSICENESTAVQWHFSGNQPWNVIMTDGTDTYTAENIGNSDSLIVSPPENRALELQLLTDRYGCEANDTNYMNTHIIKVSALPAANAGQDTSEFCGLQYELNAELDLPAPSFGRWSTSFDELTQSQQREENLISEADQYGSGVFIWTEINGVCQHSDSVYVILYEQPEEPEAGKNQELDFMFNTLLEASAPNAGNGFWTVLSGAGVFEDSTSHVSRVSNMQKNKNVFKWTVENGVCQVVSDTVVITVNDLVIPKGFTPNGDKFNEQLVIQPNDGGTIEVIIFNRYGKLVHQDEKYGANNNYWEGKNMDGDPLPAGTYYYIVKFSNSDEPPKKGFVELKR
jgi:gliding motility-associated-like protein